MGSDSIQNTPHPISDQFIEWGCCFHNTQGASGQWQGWFYPPLNLQSLAPCLMRGGAGFFQSHLRRPLWDTFLHPTTDPHPTEFRAVLSAPWSPGCLWSSPWQVADISPLMCSGDCNPFTQAQGGRWGRCWWMLIQGHNPSFKTLGPDEFQNSELLIWKW